MKRILFLCAFCLAFFSVPVVGAKKASPEDIARAQALYAEGMKQLKAEQFAQAVEAFQAAIALNEDDPATYVGLGQAFLGQNDLDGAEKAFKKALSKEKKYAPAFNGLGLVYAQKKNELRRAIAYFRDANRADKSYAEAQFNLAQTLEHYGSSETLKEYQNVLKIDPKHPEAYYRIGLIYEGDRDFEKAVKSFRDQLTANPGHDGAKLHLGMDLKALGQTDEAVTVLAEVAGTPGKFQRRAVLELAQVFQKRREFDKAAQLFDAYIEHLPEDQQALYYDLTYLARGSVLADFQKATTLTDKKAQFLAFWKGLDPAPVTAANERLLEYYRRVAFALENFGTYKKPWDARGEVYIRYGDPDHVSRSGSGINIERDPRVVAVKDRLIARAGEAAVSLARQRTDAVASTMRQRENAESAVTGQPGITPGEDPASKEPPSEASFLGWPVYPVPIDSRWEYWIYTGVGGGIEMTFIQHNYPGPYEYADVPMGTDSESRIWQELNPQLVLQNVAAHRPTTYRPDFATGPLDFYFYSAAFRGDGGQTALEVYYGIPTSELSFITGADGQQVAMLDRGVAVYDGDGNPVYRNSQAMTLQAKGAVDQTSGAMIPEVDRVSLAPGNYRLTVQVLDRNSGKSQVYQQTRSVPEFTGQDKLEISDVEMAASLDTADKARFQKGNISVVPMASLAYLPAQPVFIYFELYNLKRDAFGQTKYRVSYEVRSLEKKTVGARILGGLGQLIGQKNGEGSVAIEYEQVGSSAQEQGYLELDLSHTEPGRQLLRIHVTDENSGQTAGTAAQFAIQ